MLFRSFTALIAAASEGHEAVVRTLISKGADVNARSANGTTALKIATKKGHKNVVRLLQEAGEKD